MVPAISVVAVRPTPNLPPRTRMPRVALAALGAFLSLSIGLRAAQAPRVRVALFKGIRSVGVRAPSLRIRDVRSDRILFTSNEPVRLELEATSDGIEWGGRDSRSGYLSLVPLDGQPLKLNGRPYRGRIETLERDGRLLVINDLDLDDYVAGVINGEISSNWRIEAVKVQAVVARTYALFQKNQKLSSLYDLESGVADQVYTGAGSEDFRVRFAVRETAGEILTYHGEPIRAAYHSSCGGRTEDAADVWGTPVPYLKSVPCGYCTDAPNYYWTLVVPKDRFGRLLARAGHPIGRVREVHVLQTTQSGRARSVEIRGSEARVTLPGEALRRVLGYALLKSTKFVPRNEPEAIRFQGSGSGHGVGLCQWGAKGMADHGYRYPEILAHYYPGTTLERIY